MSSAVSGEPTRTAQTMSDRRIWIAVSIDILEHPVVGANPRRRRGFTNTEAWIWLLIKAARRTHSVGNGWRAIQLERGQVLVGQHYLAKEWGWGTQRIRGFLKQLCDEEMTKITQRNNRSPSVLTICNYDKFQFGTQLDTQQITQQTASKQPANHSHSTEKENNIYIYTKTEEDEVAPASSPPPPAPLGELFAATDTSASPRLVGATEKSSLVQEAFDAYNEVAARCDLPVARSLTPDRVRKLRARLKECGGIEGWRRALGNIEVSAFLRGQTAGSTFRADLTFMLRPEKFARLCEGGYGNGAHAQEKKLALDELPATRDSGEIARRFDLWVDDKTTSGAKIMQQQGRQVAFEIFQQIQIRRADREGVRAS